MPSLFSSKRQRSTSQPASALENTAMINDSDSLSPTSPNTPASPSPRRNRGNSGSVVSPVPIPASHAIQPPQPGNTYAPLNLSDMEVDFSANNPYHSVDTDGEDLPPPRPFFLSQSQSRGSWSSYDSYSSADPPSSSAPPSDSESPIVVNTEVNATNNRSASATSAGAVARRKMTNSGYSTLPPGAAAPRRDSTVEGYAGIGSGNSVVAPPTTIRSPSPLSASHVPSGTNSVLEKESFFNGSSTNATATPTPTRPPSAPPVSSAQSRLTSHQRNHSRGNIPPPSSFRASSELAQPTPLNPPKDFSPRPYDGPVNPDPIPSARNRSNSHASSLKKASAESLNGTSSDPASVNAHTVDPQFVQQMAYPPQQYAQMGQHPSLPMPIPPFARPGAYTYGHNAYLANSAIARASAISAASSNVNINGMQMMGPGNMVYPNMMGLQSMQSLNAMPGNMTPVATYGEDGQVELTNGQNSALANGRDSADYGFPQESGTPPPIITAGNLPRTSSHIREPFLSPASRVSSSVWHPPPPVSSYSATSWYGYPVNSINYGYPSSQMNAEGVLANGGATPPTNGLILPNRKEPLPSSALRRKLSKSDKPWLKRPSASDRWAWWTTFLLLWLGIGGAGVVCFFGYRNVPQLGRTCLVFEDDFNSLDTNTWFFEQQLGGMGNGEFEMYTNSPNNTYTQNGELYIYPTLTSDSIGTDAIFNGYTYNISSCTTTNATACSATSDASTGSVINPVMSGRISTINSHSIKYGMVEVMAKLPTGDWLWPAIWLLPVNQTYGTWPLSGEIDLMEARGNGITYPAQGSNFVRSSLAFGPLAQLAKFVFGWESNKRVSYADDFHLYRLEWNDQFIRMSVDERTLAMLTFQFTSPFFERGGFPQVVQNGSVEAVVTDPWATSSTPNAAPFDQEFYLLLNVAVGGTSGFFPNNVGGKVWIDGAADAMYEFAKDQDTWYETWPTNPDDRAFRIDYVKMYELC